MSCLNTNLSAQSRLSNGAELFQTLLQNQAIHPSFQESDLSELRIAIIDDSFEQLERYQAELSPKIQKVSLTSDSDSAAQFGSLDKHGLAMAQIFLAASGAIFLDPSKHPSIYLISTRGYTEFSKAIDFCLKKDRDGKRTIDLVLHSRNFPWGSDFVGGGFFNSQVKRATDAGIIWVNSAGNLGKSTFFSRIYTTSNNEVKLPGPNNTLIFETLYDDQSFDFYLSWNDFKDSPDYATSKDLDFAIYKVDPQSQSIENKPIEGGVSVKKQKGRFPKSDSTQESGNAFESIGVMIPERGMYAIKIFDRSSNFTNKDFFQLKILAANPRSLNFVSHNRLNELGAPADMKEVFSVGVANTPFSSLYAARSNSKPDVLIDLSKSNFQFQYSDGVSTGLDTSSAAAVFAGIVAKLMSADPYFSQQKLKSYLQRLGQSQQGPTWIAPMVNYKASTILPRQNMSGGFRPMHRQ